MPIQNTITKVQNRRKAIGYEGNLLPPASDREILETNKLFDLELGTEMPKELEKFYRCVKGLNHNGAFFWLCTTDLTRQHDDNPDDDRSWRIGIVERTLEFWEMTPHNRPLIQVGAHDSGWYIYDPRTQEYADMDTCGDILYRTRSFEELFEYAFKDRLG